MRGISLLLALCVGTAFAGLVESQRSIHTNATQAFKTIGKAKQNSEKDLYSRAYVSRKATDTAVKATRKDLDKAAKRSKTAIY